MENILNINEWCKCKSITFPYTIFEMKLYADYYHSQKTKEIEEELRICSNYEYMNITIFKEHIKRFKSLLKKLQ